MQSLYHAFVLLRPKLNFREMQAEHLNETIYYPGKPDWQTIQITLYDRCINTNHPVWAWVTQGNIIQVR